MFLLNLSVAEFLVLLGSASALITALYFFDRTKQKKIVSSLRFWTPAAQVHESRARRRITEPLSLFLQLAGVLLLLFAAAGLEWGARDRGGRDHVLLLDTSAWTGERRGPGILLDEEKRLARQYLARLEDRDRIMLVRVDALATPVVPFTRSRRPLLAEIEKSRPGFSALNMQQALLFARRIQGRSGRRPGDIAYVGPGLVAPNEASPEAIPNFRVMTVNADREHVGIRRMGVKQDDETDSSTVFVTLKNYGQEERALRLNAHVGGKLFPPRQIQLLGGREITQEYRLATNAAGEFTAEIEPPDALRADDRAALTVPRRGPLRVAVFTARPEVLRLLLTTNHRVAARFFDPAQYTPKSAAEVVLLDRIAPDQLPQIPALWIDPPRKGSPFTVKDVRNEALINDWDTILAAGLHSKEPVADAQAFQIFQGDIPVANTSFGPVVVARAASQNHPKFTAIGFDPLSNELRFEVRTPLLIADLLAWLSPDASREIDVSAGPVGAATVSLDSTERTSRLRVVDDKGAAVPFTTRGPALQLFVSRPTVVRILSGDRERVLSLTLPEIADLEWKPPANPAMKPAIGLPPATFSRGPVTLWRYFAILGAFLLLIEWLLFGRRRSRRHLLGNRDVLKPASEREDATVAK